LSVDLEWEELQTAIADSVASYCSDRCDEQAARAAFDEFPRDLWKGLADLGVLALGSDNAPMEICAAMESLGRALFPGPLAATFMSAGVFEGATRDRLTSGEAIVSFSAGGLAPWAAAADVFLVLDGGRLFEAEPSGEIIPIDTVGGEPWARVELERVRALGDPALALAMYDMCIAAYAASCGNRLVELTCEHVRTRKQFGRAIGEFQAVAHPLADASMRLAAAVTLARAAAFELASGAARATSTAAAARLSAGQAGIDAAEICHQAFGALGVTIEGPVFPFTRRLRQLASLPPTAATGGASVLSQFAVPAAPAVPVSTSPGRESR